MKRTLILFVPPSYLDIGEVKKRPMETVSTEVMQVIVTAPLCVSHAVVVEIWMAF